MSDSKQFNPIATAKRIEEAYRDYLATTIHFQDPELQAQLREILERKGFLAGFGKGEGQK